MKKTQIHQFDPILYPYKFWIIVTDDLKVVQDNFTERNGDNIKFVGSNTHEAMVLDIRKKSDPINDKGQGLFGAVIIYRNKGYMSNKNIAHESSHATKRCFEHIGADVSEHEPFEYLLGWLVDCTNQVKLNKFK